MIATKKTSEYDRAAALLRDLRAVPLQNSPQVL